VIHDATAIQKYFCCLATAAAAAAAAAIAFVKTVYQAQHQPLSIFPSSKVNS
jgi:hypothetical protein